MCKKQNWASLHNHTSGYSLDGVSTLSQMVAGAAEMGFSHLASTEHGQIGGLVQLAYECGKHNIKPIFGNEVYVCIGKDVSKTYHLTLLADGERGFKTLVKLNNIAVRSEISSRRPVFDIFDLVRYNDGIVVLSGCPSSPLHGIEEYSDAKDVYAKLIHHLGKDKIFCEIMPHSTPFLKHEAWERSIQFAKDFDLTPIITNDVHYLREEDKAVQQIITKLKAGFDYDASGLYLRSDDEMLQTAYNVGGEQLYNATKIGMRNSLWLADKIQPKVFTGEAILPKIEDAEDKLTKLAFDGLTKLGLDCNPEAVERLEYELDIINQKGFAPYTLIVHEITDVARKADVAIGYGRGSAAGSLVSYCIGITETDPLKYNLQFERYLNPLRNSPVDIDCDFGSKGRDIILDYMGNKYNAVGVAAYSTYSHRSLIWDLCRYFGIDRQTTSELSDKYEDLENEIGDKICKAHPLFRQAYNTMMGTISHISRHAAGIAISDGKTEVPLLRLRKGEYASCLSEAGNHSDLSTYGLYKFDILAVSYLDMISELRQKFGVRPPAPEDDLAPLELLRSGNTLGVFQFHGSDYKVNYIKDLEIEDFETMIDFNALWRESVLMSGGGERYKAAKSGDIQVLHPFVDDIVSTTCGIILYQEQAMEIYSRIVGGTLGDADEARRALVKYVEGEEKSEKKVRELREKFFNGCKSNSIDDIAANKIWAEMFNQRLYSFNRSHAAAYALLGYECLWWKYYHKLAFYTAFLNSNPSLDSQSDAIFELVRSGDVEIVMPHINVSSMQWEEDGSKIYAPLTATFGLGVESPAAKMIIENKPYHSFKDFNDKVTRRTVNSRIRKHLYYIGAFEGLEGSPLEMGLKQEDIDYYNGTPKDDLVSEFFTITIPDRKQIDTIEKCEALGNQVAGFVTELEETISDYYGEVIIAYLSPRGRCRVNSKTNVVGNLKKGKFIKATGLSSGGLYAKKVEIN